VQVDGAVVVVTGASSGIGAATARAAAAAGARVVLVARREDRIAVLAAELGAEQGRALAVRCDVTDPTQVAAALQAALRTFGRVDVVVNNAGQGLQGTVEDVDLDDVRAVLELNVLGPLIVMQAAAPLLRAGGGGSIVNISSGTTLAAVPGTGPYAASKSALEKLSAVARAELAPHGITVSCLLPFATSTEFMSSIRAGREAAEEMTAGAVFDAPERVAEAVLDLVRTGAAQVDLVPAAYGGSA
jgi:NAD(P)-dependent dehydrogenase (short-subunit alcohol dehydrogenase family)